MHYVTRSWWCQSLICLVVLMGMSSTLRAHETDPYTFPPGRTYADLGGYFTRWFYDRMARAVEKTNGEIRAAIDAKDTARLKTLHSPRYIADAVNHQFPDAYSLIEGLESKLYTSQMQQRYPGQILAAKSLFGNTYWGMFLPIDPRQMFRIWDASTIEVFGVYCGTDKIGHFTDMGIRYYHNYRQALDDGKTKAQAVQAALDLGTENAFFSEGGVLGRLSSGDYSNGDLAANYLGFLYYRNLTETVNLKGEDRPPMLVRRGAYWQLAPHVRRDSDFLSWFFSDHLDEALNPGYYEADMRGRLGDNIKQRTEYLLWRYHDMHGCRRPPQYFVHKMLALHTYYGRDYGHAGEPDHLLCLGTVCFDWFKADAPVNARNDVGWTPLDAAVVAGDVKHAAELLDRGAAVNARIRSKETWSAAWGQTPLHLAARDGRLAIAQLLIARGANVNAMDDRGVTPLHMALKHPKIALLLLAHGARVDAKDERGRTPLYWASADPAGTDVSVLLAHRADPNAADNDGRTPLHAAARTGTAKAELALIQHGANVNARDDFGLTPLHLAATRRSPALAADLIDHHAKVNAHDDFGWTPLHDAARHDLLAVAKLLMRHSATVNAVDDYGNTPLHLACRHDAAPTAALLMNMGAVVNAANSVGMTPMHEAAFADNRRIVEQLLAMGGEPDVRNHKGITPRQLAAHLGYDDVAALIERSQRQSMARK